MSRRIRPNTADGAADGLKKKTGVKGQLIVKVGLHINLRLVPMDALLPFFFQANQLRRQLSWDECAAPSVSLCLSMLLGLILA